MPVALLIIGAAVVLAVLMIVAINRYATGNVTCALTGLKLEERPKSKVAPVLLPVESSDGQIAYVKHDVMVNENAAVLLKEQGMPAFRQTLRFLEPDSLIYMMNASHNFFMPAKASKVFAFLHENGPEGYDQAFDDYLSQAYDVTVETYTKPAEAPAPEEADIPTVDADPVPDDMVVVEWEGLGAAGKTLEQEVAGLQDKSATANSED